VALVGLLSTVLAPGVWGASVPGSEPGDLECPLGPRPGCLAWVERWQQPGDPGHHTGRAVATTPDGSIVLVTTDRTDLAYEPETGRLLWSAPNDASGAVGARDLGVSPSGSMMVSTGEAAYPHPERVTSGEVVVTARQPASGRPLWQARHRDPGQEPYTPQAVAVTEAGVFVAGDGGLFPRHLFTAAFDPQTGSLRWLSRHGADHAGRPPGPTRTVAVAATPDGQRVFVTGFMVVQAPNVEWVTLAYDGRTGALLWSAGHPGGGDFAAEPKQMVLHPDGHLVYVTGWSRRPGAAGESYDFVTIAYDTATGRPVWTDGFRSPVAGPLADSDDLGWSVEVSRDGRRLYVAGYSEDPVDPDPGGPNYRLEARDALTGAPLWSAAVPSFSATSDEQGLFGHVVVRSSPDGGEVYLAMAAHDDSAPRRYGVHGSPYRDVVFAVAGFDAASGRFLWRGTYAAPDVQTNYAVDLAVDPAGRRIYVTGAGRDPSRAYPQTTAFLVR
jgi:DNA-binding beta-propeller fold protein YncE